MLTSYNAIGLNGGLGGFSISYSLKINPKSIVLMQGPQSAVLAVKKSFLKTDVCCGLLHTGNGKTWQ